MSVDLDEEDLAQVLGEVRRIQAQSRRLVRSVMAGGYSSVFRGSGLLFDEVREFADGDDPRRIDWKVTARTGRPHVKKYVDEREQTAMFLLDVSDSMRAGSGGWSARQVAVRLCACLSFAAVHNHDKVGLVAFGRSGVVAFVPPRRGSGHALRIIRDALMAREPKAPAEAGASGLGSALELASRMLRRRSVLFVASDWFWPSPGRKLRECASRHDLTAIRLLSPELFPPRGLMARVSDPESGRRATLDFRSERVRSAWLERVASWRARWDLELAQAGADLMDVPTPMRKDQDAIAGPILDFFRRRQLRGSRR